MVRQIVLSGFIGGVLAFFWGFFAWGPGELWSSGFKGVPNEAPLLSAFEPSGITESTAYYFPAMPADMGNEADMEAWKARHRSKAIGILLVQPGGAEAMSPIVFIRGFLVEVCAAMMLAVIIGAGGGTAVVKRAGMLIVAVAFAVLATHGVMWNFMSWPAAWGRVMVIDTAITWILAGLPAVLLMRGSPKAA